MKLLWIGVLALVFSCTKNKPDGLKELNLASPAKVAGFDPAQASDLYMSNEIGKVYEGLYEFHPTKRPYELMPNLAESLPEVSADGLTYTFKIKKGVLFHDDECFVNKKGRELKASDFIYTFKRLADPKVMSKGWWLFDGKISGLNEWREKSSKLAVVNYDEEVSGLKLIDEYSFQIKLKNPYPQFLYSLTMPYAFVVARDAVEKYGKEFLNHPVGTGPFILPLFDQSNKIVYHKNPSYREKFHPQTNDRIPLVDRITVNIMTESQPKWFSFMKGKLDLSEVPKDNFAESVGPDKNITKELAAKGMVLDFAPMLDVTFYAFNHDDPLFKNLNLRKAMSMAYNRAVSNKLFFNSTALTAQGVIPPGIGGHDENFKNPFVEYNLEKAKEYLKLAGYPDGKGLPEITVQTTSDTTSRQMLEFFMKCMNDIGIKIKIGTNTWPELVNKVTKRQYQMYTMAWYADYPDAENFLGLLYCPNQSPGSNGANYCNPAFDELYKKATIMQDSPERSKLYQDLNYMASLDVPWILGFHRTRFYLRQGWIKNFNYTEFTQSQYQYLGVDLDQKNALKDKF